jgi:hypothetical protein
MTKYQSELFPKISELLYNLHMRGTGCARCNTASLSVRIRGVGSIKTSRVHRLPGALLDIEKGTKKCFPRNVGDGRGWGGENFSSHTIDIPIQGYFQAIFHYRYTVVNTQSSIEF